MSDWRPIETVPQDGTPVLIWLLEVNRGLPGAEVAQCWGLGANDERVFWTNGGPNAGEDVDEWSSATHWMPLPAAPQPKADPAPKPFIRVEHPTGPPTDYPYDALIDTSDFTIGTRVYTMWPNGATTELRF